MRNIQGDVTALVYVNANGIAETAVEYYYSAFGEVYVDVFSGNIDFSAIAELNPIRYRGYFYDTETGFYYLDSRYYDPEIGRFINGDAQINNDILGSNIFTYCSNNPINYVDPTGKAGLWLLDYLQNFCSEFLNALNALSPAYATSSGLALADGPLPFGEILAGLVITGLTVGAIGYSAFQATQVKSNTKVKEETDDPPSPTVIYRHGGTNPGNLTPSKRDVNLYPITGKGLSFSTIPKPGSAMTTIEALNATGVVYAVCDGVDHVSVHPIGGTLADWHNAGSSSVWTKAVKSVVVKWNGGN